MSTKGLEMEGLRMGNAPLNRRAALKSAAAGFGWLAFAGMRGFAAMGSPGKPLPVLPARAKRVIFLFMQGGPSQVDTFDPKPLLQKYDGSQMPFDDARVIANTGKRGTDQRVMRSPWTFQRHGASGRSVSELFPHVARHVDDLCFIHSMKTEGVAHGPATLFLHCGATQSVRPSMGAWVSYGLGSENDNLPSFVTIAPSMGNGGVRNFGNAFLPAVHQGTAIGVAGQSAASLTLRNLVSTQGDHRTQRRQMELIQAINGAQLARLDDRGAGTDLEAMVQSYELAWRMQLNAPGILDLEKESAATRELYGIGRPETDDFGRQCLMARRLAESGVRFIQVTYGDNTANPRWDQHSNLPKHADHARAVDQPIAGLLTDLKARGLLDDTLVWWGAEFGRTPYAEKNGTGRDHNPDGFTVWLAGGGVRAGHAHGTTDEFGHRAATAPVHMHDLHATILHLMGLDHERLTYRHDGRDFRLTDVHGEVVKGILQNA